MMHTLRNRKTGRKSARRRFTEARHTSGPPFIRISQARSRTLIQISRPLWASKPDCDAHICLNLGFTSQNFRLSQVSLHLCYFWLSSSRMDEGNPLPSEQVNWSRFVEIRTPKIASRHMCGPTPWTVMVYGYI